MKIQKADFTRSCKTANDSIILSSSTKTGAADWRCHNTEVLLEEAQEIVQFAKDEINFDAEMDMLNAAIQSGDIKKIVTAISEAKQIAAEKLEHEGYQQFCRYLLKKHGLLRDGD
jgi:hypothetical protein